MYSSVAWSIFILLCNKCSHLFHFIKLKCCVHYIIISHFLPSITDNSHSTFFSMNLTILVALHKQINQHLFHLAYIKPIHIVVVADFLSLINIPPCIYHIFVCLRVLWCTLGLVPSLTVGNNSMNTMYNCLFKVLAFNSLEYCPVVELLDYMVTLFSIFWGTTILLPQ